MGFMNINLSGASFSDYKLTDVGSSAFELEHDWFTKEDLEIWTGAGKTGTQLVEGTDYQLSEEDEDLSFRVSQTVGENRTVYHKVTIINATYQTGDLYFSGKYIADSIDADDINNLIPIGFVYIQFQGSGALKSAPGSLFSGTWTDITGDEFAGHFFRAYKSGLSAAMGTQQADALQGHEHKHDDPSVISSYRNNLESGSNGNQINAKNVATRGLMSDGVNGTPRSASETRPINYAIHIWERTA